MWVMLMPLYEFRCPFGHLTEDIYPLECPHEIRCPVCMEVAERVHRVYPVVTVGPIFSGMERFEEALLTPAERRGRTVVASDGTVVRVIPPIRFKSVRDIEAYEREHGLSRLEPESSRARELHEAETADAEGLAKAKAEGGEDGRWDYLRESTIKDETGWDDSTYTRWRDINDAIETEVSDAHAPA